MAAGDVGMSLVGPPAATGRAGETEGVGEPSAVVSGNPAADIEPLDVGQSSRPPKLTHYLFRYPAKFHPPVISALIERYSKPGDLVFDPFVGSGTALVEAIMSGRRSLGMDIDPVAVEVSRAKTRRYDLARLESAAERLSRRLKVREREEAEYGRLMFADISEVELEETLALEALWVPAIPRLGHWFRRYVVVDLARIHQAITMTRCDARTRLLLRVVFASIIRNASNADPVPVSGLEYTSHMKRRDKDGRLINPFALFRVALQKALVSVADLAEHWSDLVAEPSVYQGSATDFARRFEGSVDLVLTSPPYHNAVDYYRRHQLELFWLGLAPSQEVREKLIPSYIGRPNVAMKDPLLQLPWNPPALAGQWEERMRASAPRRARDFRHYTQAMHQCFSQLAQVTRPGVKALFVVGHSSWNGQEIPTATLFQELADDFELDEILSYPVKNRYMSYARRNNASIDREYVLAFRRT
ncbi:DNA methyltransferase [Micromonospora sp. NPDC005194]|uniref:DNA methyltransferase n=1 Tax=Micromonospora sp. NPDC005194 TaxID=3156870 RepID=UPI0033A1FBD7